MQAASPRRYHSEYRRYLFTYLFGGTEWSVEIPALSLEEARERIKVLPFARCDGEVHARTSAHPVEPERRGGWFRRVGQAA